MDGKRFDAMARALGGAATGRRGALRLLGGGALGGLVGGFGRGERVDARRRCRKVGQHCHRHDCCSGNCAADYLGNRSCRIAACVAEGEVCDINKANVDCCKGNCVYYNVLGHAICKLTL